MIIRTLFLASLLGLSVLVAPVGAAPSLSSASPSALAPGKTVELTLSGAKLTGPLSVWTSFEAKVEVTTDEAAKKAAKQVRCKITPAANVPIGIGGIIVATKDGPSNVLMVMIDDLPSVASVTTNTTAASAQVVKAPVGVDGATRKAGSRFYKFNAKKDQRVSVEVVAQRLASAMDPVLWLRDSQGNELSLVDDDEALGADCRLSYTFKADGEYTIELRDNRFQGGLRYRLRIGDFPFVSTSYPLGGQIGSTVQVEFSGPAGAITGPVNVTIPAEAVNARWEVGVKSPNGQSSSMATVAVSHLPEILEIEPNNDLKEALRVALPVVLNGRFDVAGDRDVYEFVAKKGQRFTFQPVTRSVGSPSLVFLRVYKSDGSKVAETKVGSTDETPLIYAIPADGMYRLSVEDLLNRGGVDFVYRVEAREGTSGFTLSLKSDKTGSYQFTTPTNGAFSVDLLCNRSGYNGPITLSAMGPAGECQVYNNVIAAKQKTAKLIIVTPKGSSEGAFMAVRIVGTATDNGKEFEVWTDSAALLRLKFPQLQYPPSWLDGLVSVATAGDIAAFYAAETPKEGVYFPRAIGSTTFTVVPKRIDKNFKTGLTLLFDDLPEGFSYAVKTIGKVPKEKYQVTLTGPKELSQSSFALRMVSYAELNGRGLPLETTIPIEVFTPLAVSVTPAGPIVPGKKQKITIRVIRYTAGDSKARQPISLTWKMLPVGITAEAKITLAADKDAIEIEITAAADAAPNSFAQLIAQAETTYRGKSLKVDSQPIFLEVTKP